MSTAIPADAPALVVTQKMKDGAPGAVALERRPVPSPGERQLLIRISRCEDNKGVHGHRPPPIMLVIHPPGWPAARPPCG